MLEAIWREVPEIYNFAHATYNCAPHLQFGDFTILSNEGPQQGDPPSPLEFCLTIQPMLVSLTSELKIEFLDDITMAVQKDIVVNDIISIKDKTDMYGLVLNAAKCEVVYGDPLAPHDDDTLKDFQRVELENLTLLGAPVLSGRVIDKNIKQKTEKMKKAISRLPLLQAHDALTLLRNSISVPKLLYTLRTYNCSENPLLVTFDIFQRKCLTDVINIDLNEDQWTQATLTIRDGCLGIRSVAMLASSAFFASATSTLQIQNGILPARFHEVSDNAVDMATNSWRKLSGTDIPKIELRIKQKEWDRAVTNKNSTELLDRASCSVAKARLRAATAPHTGDWLLAPPISE